MGKVLDLQRLLELTAAGRGRFIHLGDNQFLALTDSFRRRLDELRAYSEQRGKDLRIHPLAAGALQDLADEAGKLKADKFWKEHLAKLSDARHPAASVAHYPAGRPARLPVQRLSSGSTAWRTGVWARAWLTTWAWAKPCKRWRCCSRARPNGPALVVAPTSVCMNWLGEVARFAPTLKVTLFGSGDRQQTLQ
jgi:hypothetical protein